MYNPTRPGTDTPGTDKPGTDIPGTDKPGEDTKPPVYNPTRPGTDTPGGANAQVIYDNNDRTVHIDHQKIVLTNEKKEREEAENAFYNSLRSHFRNTFSENGSATLLNIEVDGHIEANNKYLTVELIGKIGSEAVSFLINANAGNVAGAAKDLLINRASDAEMVAKYFVVTTSNKYLEASKKCYEEAFDIYDNPNFDRKERMILASQYLKKASEFGNIGIALSQGIYEEMREKANLVTNNFALSVWKNIEGMILDIALNTYESVFNKLNLEGAFPAANGAVSFDDAVTFMDFASILDTSTNAASGVDRMGGLVSSKNNRLLSPEAMKEAEKRSALSVETYNRIIANLAALP